MSGHNQVSQSALSSGGLAAFPTFMGARSNSEDFAAMVNGGRYQQENFEDISSWLAPGETVNNDWNPPSGGGIVPSSTGENLAAMANDYFAAPRSKSGIINEDGMMIDVGSTSDMSSGIIKPGRMSPSLSNGAGFGGSSSKNMPAKYLATLKGHPGRVSACAFDFAGRLLATGGQDRKLILWDARQQAGDGDDGGLGKLLWTLDGHTNQIQSIRFSNLTMVFNGNRALPATTSRTIIGGLPVFLASGSMDKTVRLYEIAALGSDRVSIATSEQPKHLRTFNEHKNNITGVDICPVAVAGAEGFPVSAGSGTEVRVGVFGTEVRVGVFVASVDGEAELRIWNAANGATDKNILLPCKSAFASTAVRFRPTSTWSPPSPSAPRSARPRGVVVTLACGAAHQLNLVDLALPTNDGSSRPTKVVNHKSPAFQSLPGHPVFTAGDDEYTLRTFQTPHTKNIFAVDWSSDGSWLLTASEELVCLWEVGSNLPDGGCQVVYQMPAQGSKISSCIMLQDTARAGLPSMSASTSPETPTSPTNLRGSSRPPRVLIGEYDRMSVWDPVMGSASHAVVMVPALQSGNITCLAAVGAWNGAVKADAVILDEHPELLHQEPRDLMVASGSSTREDNVRIWNFMEQRRTTPPSTVAPTGTEAGEPPAVAEVEKTGQGPAEEPEQAPAESGEQGEAGESEHKHEEGAEANGEGDGDDGRQEKKRREEEDNEGGDGSEEDLAEDIQEDN